MKLVLPTLQYKQQATEYINEFIAHSSQINGTGSLDWYLENSTYEEWLQKLVSYMDIANVPTGKVPGLTYFCVHDGNIVGMVNLRLALNEHLRTEGGHIGYSVRPTERNKGYATQILQAALEVYGVLGIHNVIITCDKDNIASARVIQKCGGVLDAEFFSKTYGEMLQRYVIHN